MVGIADHIHICKITRRLRMSITDIIVVSIAGIIVAVAVVMYIIRRKKSGSCCMGCSHCIYNQSHEELNNVTCNSCNAGGCNAVGRDECKECESQEEHTVQK